MATGTEPTRADIGKLIADFGTNTYTGQDTGRPVFGDADGKPVYYDGIDIWRIADESIFLRYAEGSAFTTAPASTPTTSGVSSSLEAACRADLSSNGTWGTAGLVEGGYSWFITQPGADWLISLYLGAFACRARLKDVADFSYDTSCSVRRLSVRIEFVAESTFPDTFNGYSLPIEIHSKLECTSNGSDTPDLSTSDIIDTSANYIGKIYGSFGSGGYGGTDSQRGVFAFDIDLPDPVPTNAYLWLYGVPEAGAVFDVSTSDILGSADGTVYDGPPLYNPTGTPIQIWIHRTS